MKQDDTRHTDNADTATATARHGKALWLTAWCALALVAMVAAAMLVAPGLDGIRMAIRATARTSLVLFILAYGAGAAFTLWPGAATRLVRTYRRQWGWLFVISHTLHFAFILAYWQMAPAQFMARTPMGTFIGGSIAYLVIWSMGITSFDRTAGMLGRAAWARLHTWGSHYIWLIFFMGNFKRVAQEPVYLLPTLLLAGVQAMRLAAWVVARRRARLKAGSASAAPA